MISVTDDIKKAYDESTTQVDKIVLDGQEYRITNVEYYDDCYEEGNIFGTAIARCLEFEIENSVNLEGKEVQYYTGVIIDGIVKWIDLGNFIVQSVEPNDTTNINKVTAMDYMLKTNVEYISNLNYNSQTITLLNVLDEACNNAGLILATRDFANSDFIVDSNQFEQGTLIRQVIQAVAQVSGSFAKIKSDNKLYLITPHKSCLLVEDVHTMTVQELNELKVEKLFLDIKKVKELTKNDYKELVVKRNTHPINVVSLGMSDIEGENITLRDEKSIAEDGENVLLINDNPFAYTQQKREQLITALFATVKGFTYTSFEISGQSKPYLEAGDEVMVIDKDGNLYNSFLFRFNYKSPNGLESEMSAPSLTKATVNYQNVPDALDIAKRTEIKVNKQEQKINATVEKINENTNKISDLEITVDGITQKVENLADLTKTISGIKTITIEDALQGSPIELKILGNNTVFDSLRLSDDLYLSDDTVLYGDSDIDISGKIYDLGIDEVLRQYEDVYDEYIYNYTENTAKVIRRIGVSENGDLYVMDNEVVESLNVPEFQLVDGVNTISIESYTANMSVTYVVKNDYNNMFATKVEMKSVISQTAEEIKSEVSKEITTATGELESEISTISQTAEQIKSTVSKHTGEISELTQTADTISQEVTKKVDNNEIIAKLNVAVKDKQGIIELIGNIVKIISDNFTLDENGVITAKAGTVGGFTITSDSLDSSTTGMSNGHQYAFYVKNGGTTPYYVTMSGDIACKSIIVNGFPLSLTSAEEGKQIVTNYIDGNQLIVTTANSLYVFLPDSVSSDETLKTNIEDTNVSALETIQKILFRQFDWLETGAHEKLGVIAQEIEQIEEEFVSEVEMNGKKTKVFNISKMILYNSKAIQELKEENTSLKSTIEALIERIERLEKKEGIE